MTSPFRKPRGAERRQYGRRLWDRLRRRTIHAAYMAITLIATAATYGITDMVKEQVAMATAAYWTDYARGNQACQK